jgi:phosphatidate cytidylyltransferase
MRRVGMWWLIGPLFFGAALGGVLTMAVFAVGVILQSLREFARLVGLGRIARSALVVAGVGAIMSMALAPSLSGAIGPIFLVGMAAAYLADGRTGGAVGQLGGAVFGLTWIVLPLGLLVEMRRGDDGLLLVVLVGLGVALSDVGAFVVGSLLGRQRLTPVSPNKTRAGLAGNVAGATGATALLWFGAPPEWTVATGALLTSAIVIGAVVGDLTESLVKREAGVKDAGRALPGFGGVLDRIDSLLFASPLVYVAVVLGVG